MQKLKKALGKAKKYPIMLLFFLLLSAFTLVDVAKPDKAMSTLENRPLQQAPSFNATALINNQWTVQYGEYTKDQFLLRDNWVSLQSVLETAQGKLENGGVWYAEDGYQIAKNSTFSDLQRQRLPQNTQSLIEFAARHADKTDVMVVPSPANILSPKLPWSPPQIDENAMLDDIFGQVQATGAQVLDLRQVYLQNRDAQLFYKTDHHWTTRGGAALAYEAFCTANGLAVAMPPEDVLVGVEGFRGTNFNKTKRAGTPGETMEYYDLPNLLTIYRPDDEGYSSETVPLMDTAKLTTPDKYAAFLWGNNGYSEIEGNGEGSILLIKDSYGNSFAPYLIEHYAKIGIVDLRGWTDAIDDTIAAGGYEHILVLYSFDTFTQDQYIYRLQDSSQN